MSHWGCWLGVRDDYIAYLKKSKIETNCENKKKIIWLKIEELHKDWKWKQRKLFRGKIQSYFLYNNRLYHIKTGPQLNIVLRLFIDVFTKNLMSYCLNTNLYLDPNNIFLLQMYFNLLTAKRSLFLLWWLCLFKWLQDKMLCFSAILKKTKYFCNFLQGIKFRNNVKLDEFFWV